MNVKSLNQNVKPLNEKELQMIKGGGISTSPAYTNKYRIQ